MQKYDVAAYVWPSYTGDEPRTRIFWPQGFGEWETVMDSKPKFEGHHWPRKPVWGYVNEADAAVMEMQINEATRHGVNVFIYDWYWYDKRPFLENCLNDGFLKAPNNKKMKFYLMWANHNVNHLWDRRTSSTEKGIIWYGTVNRAEFEEMAERMIDKYFGLDNYYTIEDKPVLMIYDVENLVCGFGGVEKTREALEWMRQRMVEKGYKGLHLQFCIRGDRDPKEELIGKECTYASLCDMLGADSASAYQSGQLTGFRCGDFLTQLEEVKKACARIDQTFNVPFFPHVSCGWDNNARHKAFMPNIIVNNTPENLEIALQDAKDYVDTHKLPAPLIIVNSWNEWTEDSYLQPDDRYGYGYLNAVKNVFGGEE